MKTDVVIVGGGPGGMAGAYGVAQTGANCVILERDERLGGILNQCIHNGFGLHKFNEELTGPEYARRWIDMISKNPKISVKLGCFVDSIVRTETGYLVTALCGEDLLECECKAVLLTLGCRERPAGAIMLCGSRPSGIYTAGCAQRLINIDGKSVGKKVVILGSGDIGLIMARRLTCEGAEVVGVYEIMSQSGGLARNITQCLNDFDIPLHLSTTVTRVVGKERLQGVYVAPVNEKLQPILELEKFVECDTLLLSVGLQPETEIASDLGLEWCGATNSYAVDEYYMTASDGLFMAGNVLHVNDLVDNVSREGESAGLSAGEFALGKLPINAPKIEIEHDEHIKYTAPKYIHDTGVGLAQVSFRVNKNYKRVIIKAISGGAEISRKPCPAVTSGEMQTISIDKSKIVGGKLYFEIEVMK